jgi:hypothetical protein
MVAVRMMKAPVHEIIDMVAVRHRFVAAIRPVPMRRLVASGVVLRIATIGVHVAHCDPMLMGPTALAVFKAAVIEVIDVAFMLHGDVAASGAMNVVGSLARSARFGCHSGSFVAHPQSSARIVPKLANGQNRTSRRLLAAS